MSTSSISSSTGPLDVQGLVSQLMTVAQQPLNRMNSTMQTENSQISDYGNLSSDLTSLQSSLTGLASGAFINTLQATSSNTSILSATADNTANAGNYNITVNTLASSQNLALTGQASESTSLGNTADTMKFTFGDGSTQSVSIAADATLDQIAASINSAGIGVAASVVKADSTTTPYRLVLTGNTVGAGQSFSTSTTGGQSALSFLNFDASSAVDSSGKITDSRLTAQAQDASLTVNGLTMTSSSNTVTNAVLGVSMNLTQTGTTVLTVARDSAAIQKQLQSFVTAYNKVQSDSTSLYQGDLQGDFNLVQLQQSFDSILQTPISGADGTSQVAYLAQIGISIQKDGSLSLDTAALNTAISKDPKAVANLFGNDNNDGFAQRFNNSINNMLGPQGLITTRITSLNQMVATQKDQIAQEQNRLSTVQAGYLTLYSNLNSALMEMEQTSSSLTKMLSSSSS
ncbi:MULTISPECIES: flagellar filament capping protein FliD [unclassified Paludibacterium]|uniref:flagellar filament capping protein FliD n=1 Tax=unclassified Paludibacterium TaxID=2618429 RepID=UPI001C059123|nr:flagellar filament capping protein FliD [Paludibacterium sp. B53371]BEV71419.1 flagellar filament capping protein FliD [Paludibacterium sp. THUN1379]